MSSSTRISITFCITFLGNLLEQNACVLECRNQGRKGQFLSIACMNLSSVGTSCLQCNTNYLCQLALGLEVPHNFGIVNAKFCISLLKDLFTILPAVIFSCQNPPLCDILGTIQKDYMLRDSSLPTDQLMDG